MTNKQNRVYRFTKCLTVPLLLSLGLTACNSSNSSSNNSNNASDLLTGEITGVSIEGLNYQTESHSGVTSADSTFTFKKGESVSFFIGDIAIGQASAATELTLFDLVGITDPDSIAEGAETKLKQANRNSFQFEHLSNLVVLLTAIDEDGYFANGVVIPSNLESVAQGKTLDILGSKTNTFKLDLTDSKLLDEGVWQTTPTIVSPGMALDAFYTAMGITPEVYTVSKELYDTDEDGSTDFTASYAFDDAGNLVSTTKETNDLRLSEVTTYAYDDSGNTTGLYIDYENDGVIDRQQEWAFDKKGHETLNQTDSDGNGIFEIRKVNEIAYHAAGNISDYTQSYEQYSDSTGELVRLNSSAEKYDTQGNRIYESYSHQDNDQISTSNVTYTFNSAGKKTKEEVDNNGDGTLDVIHNYGYDNEQRQILEESDLDGNGEIDKRETVIFDDSSNTVTVNLDSNANGVIDTLSTALYDDNRNIASQYIDEGNDGTFEEITTWDYTYDAEGNVLSKNKVSTTSPEENQLTTFSYDGDGRLLIYSEVFANSPEQNYLNTTTFDDAGNATFYSVEHGVINTDSYHRYTTVIHDTYGGQTSTTYGSNNEVVSIDTTLYDERRNLVEQSSTITNTYSSDTI